MQPYCHPFVSFTIVIAKPSTNIFITNGNKVEFRKLVLNLMFQGGKSSHMSHCYCFIPHFQKAIAPMPSEDRERQMFLRSPPCGV